MQRRAIEVRGTVQGVGFRPFVHGLASRLGLGGFVINSGGLVKIEIEGEAGKLDTFLSDLTAQLPPLAKIDTLEWEVRPVRGEYHFHIEHSDHESSGQVVIPPDAATCDACLAELFDPADRRYRYPFLNCTNCGPRLTIIKSAPYDRERTTMAAFGMCAACRAE
ncbi:MAG TPA: acylphosphatase, partial [Tepidisphaeraceae bacterium]|nr:acylphosphatase [Tepidisphaeraceae bacterium]